MVRHITKMSRASMSAKRKDKQSPEAKRSVPQSSSRGVLMSSTSAPAWISSTSSKGIRRSCAPTLILRASKLRLSITVHDFSCPDEDIAWSFLPFTMSLTNALMIFLACCRCSLSPAASASEVMTLPPASDIMALPPSLSWSKSFGGLPKLGKSPTCEVKASASPRPPLPPLKPRGAGAADLALTGAAAAGTPTKTLSSAVVAAKPISTSASRWKHGPLPPSEQHAVPIASGRWQRPRA
mmetsp:Transcript_101777/g.227377  ORF Transcript_101777/g.227377 Transcript_101777/m.227377 type:complete len:239 (-) Transcript_101777:78-794(-)